MPSQESFTTTESSMSEMISKICLHYLRLRIKGHVLFILSQMVKLKDFTGLLKLNMFAGHHMFRLHTQKSKWRNGLPGITQNALTEQFSILLRTKFSTERWDKDLQKEKRNSMMQVSSDRNTGEINHNSSHLDNLISFYKFVQVHLGRNSIIDLYGDMNNLC